MTDKNKIKTMLDSLNEIQEQLLALPDDMLLSIDPRDNESIEEGAEFIKTYNNRLSKFTACVNGITEHLKVFFEVDPEKEEVETDAGERKSRDRIIQELDRSEAHSLDENFTYKRPYGFVLNERAFKGLKTWKNLYLHVLDCLYETDPARFAALPQEKLFISRRGNPLFSKNPEDLRVAEQAPGNLLAEINLSANSLIKNISELLAHFSIETSGMKIYLREDRDAEKN